ncbi:MAG TPA: glycosyltransferase family 2 protein [Gammaproteobacteria bacterium]|nr:glycosyltransferase family 2 protein [Gammaproteobacteria bacterium]
MYGLENSLWQFLHASVAWILDLTPRQALLMLWPFLLLSLPRYMLTGLFVFLLSFRPEPREKARFMQRLAREQPMVSILLPGYNEHDTLEGTVLSLREQSYPNFEIIVVSDGSDDGMDKVGRKLAARGWVRFFDHKIRGGKVSAANFALEAARGDYIAICDADSTFDRDAIWHLMAEFYRPDVYAVAGNLRVRNADANLLTRCQAMQYVLSIGLGRRVSAMLGILFIVSGAFGAFRRDALERVGGWDTGPGEDADLTIKLRMLGGRVAFAPLAMCMTDAPDKWWGYFKQQMRWNRSTVRLRLGKYSRVLRPGHPFRWSNLLASLDVVVFQVVFGFTFPVYLVWLFYNYPREFPYFVVGVSLLYVCVNFVSYGLALALSERPREDVKLLPYLPLYGLFSGWYLRTVRILAYLDELFFRSSYREPYVPEYVQKETRKTHPW